MAFSKVTNDNDVEVLSPPASVDPIQEELDGNVEGTSSSEALLHEFVPDESLSWKDGDKESKEEDGEKLKKGLGRQSTSDSRSLGTIENSRVNGLFRQLTLDPSSLPAGGTRDGIGKSLRSLFRQSTMDSATPATRDSKSSLGIMTSAGGGHGPGVSPRTNGSANTPQGEGENRLLRQTTMDQAKSAALAAAAVRPAPSPVVSAAPPTVGFLSKLRAKKDSKEPPAFFEHFVVVGLHPHADVEATEAAFAARKAWEKAKARAEKAGDASTPFDSEYRGPATPALEPQLLFQFPPEKRLPMKGLPGFCFPNGIQARMMERSPSMSDFNDVLYGQGHVKKDDQSFIFLLKVADNVTLYGVCVIVNEVVQKPPSIIQMGSETSPPQQEQVGRYLVRAPRCYCLLTQLPFFALHFEVLNCMLQQERLARIRQHMDGPNPLAALRRHSFFRQSSRAVVRRALEDEENDDNDDNDEEEEEVANSWQESAIPLPDAWLPPDHEPPSPPYAQNGEGGVEGEARGRQQHKGGARMNGLDVPDDDNEDNDAGESGHGEEEEYEEDEDAYRAAAAAAAASPARSSQASAGLGADPLLSGRFSDVGFSGDLYPASAAAEGEGADGGQRRCSTFKSNDSRSSARSFGMPSPPPGLVHEKTTGRAAGAGGGAGAGGAVGHAWGSSARLPSFANHANVNASAGTGASPSSSSRSQPGTPPIPAATEPAQQDALRGSDKGGGAQEGGPRAELRTMDEIFRNIQKNGQWGANMEAGAGAQEEEDVEQQAVLQSLGSGAVPPRVSQFQLGQQHLQDNFASVEWGNAPAKPDKVGSSPAGGGGAGGAAADRRQDAASGGGSWGGAKLLEEEEGEEGHLLREPTLGDLPGSYSGGGGAGAQRSQQQQLQQHRHSLSLTTIALDYEGGEQGHASATRVSRSHSHSFNQSHSHRHSFTPSSSHGHSTAHKPAQRGALNGDVAGSKQQHKQQQQSSTSSGRHEVLEAERVNGGGGGRRARVHPQLHISSSSCNLSEDGPLSSSTPPLTPCQMAGEDLIPADNSFKLARSQRSHSQPQPQPQPQQTSAELGGGAALVDSSESHTRRSARSYYDDDSDDSLGIAGREEEEEEEEEEDDDEEEEDDYGIESVREWAEENDNDPLRLICDYYYMGVPSFGGSLTFCIFGNATPFTFLREAPTIADILGRPYAGSDAIHDQKPEAVAAAEEALSIASWALATACRALSLENILAMLLAAMLEKQIIVICPNLILPSELLVFLDAPVPFVVGVQHKTPDVRSKAYNLIRVNVYKDKENDNDPLRLICDYYYMGVPSFGGSLTFCIFGNATPFTFLREAPTIADILGRPYAGSDAIHDQKPEAVAAAEEALSIASWALATACRALSLENILAMLLAAMLEKQIIVICPNLGVLSAVVLSLVAMLRPYVWQSVLLPVKLISALPALPQYSSLFAKLKPYHRRLAAEPHARARPVYKTSEEQRTSARLFLAVLREFQMSLCRDLELHSITDVRHGGERVSLLLKDSFVAAFPVRDRPFVKAFADTQMFAVHSDAILSASEVC
eukprot:jgi/Mesen1/10480/ME000083S09993